MDAVTRYLRVFEELRSRKRWSTDTNVLRFAALSLAAADLDDPAGELEAAADELRKRAGWFGNLNSPIRYVVAAMILRKRLRPGPVHRAVGEVREAFRKRKYPRGGTREVLAALLLVLLGDGRRPAGGVIDRVGAILKRWKRDHRFLTGADDYPMAALHAWRDDDVETLGTTVERVYRTLRRSKFSMGNSLQLASHILALSPDGPDAAARRCVNLRRAFENQRHRIPSNLYDELALLVLTPGTPGGVARRVLSDVDRLRSARPRPSKTLAFSLAAGVALSRAAESRPDMAISRDAAALAAAQALLDAQAAAVAASVAVTVAATSAATSGS
jgi:hypothetical protein